MITCKTSVTLSGGFVRLPPHTLTLPAESILMMTMLMLLVMVMTDVVIFFHGRSRFAKKKEYFLLCCQVCTLCVTLARVNYLYQAEHLVFLDGTLLATNRTVPEAEEPW